MGKKQGVHETGGLVRNTAATRAFEEVSSPTLVGKLLSANTPALLALVAS